MRPSRAKRKWAEVAAVLGVDLKTVEEYIAQGVLKVYDPRITEKSLRNFLHRNGSMVNYESLSRDTRDWLQTEMDFVPNAGEEMKGSLEARRKHATVMRKCACGRVVRGNAFFRHTKNCRRDQQEADSIPSRRI